MSASYIPKDVYAICTFQTDTEPRKLIPTRETITVFYGTDKTRPLLTVDDRNINKEFPCKSPKNAMWSFLCFGAGLIVGALLIASGPVGWLIVAGVASMAIGAYYATKIEHKCSGALGDSASSWKIEHLTVKFDQKKAITHNSMLSCSTGGVLTPIFSYAVAKKYAEEINNNNSREITFNAIASFFGGAGAALSIAEMGLALTVKWALGTMAFVHVGTTVQREVIRENSLEDNQYYQNMNDEVDQNSLIPGYVKDPLNSTPGDLGSPDILNVGKEGVSAPYFVNPFWYIRDIKGNIAQIKQGTQLAKDLEVLKNVDSREIWKTPEGKQIVENIRSGKYPNSMVAKSMDGLGRVRPRNLPVLAEDLPNVRLQNIKNIGTAGVKGGGFIAFVFPFIATYFSEDSRKALANAMAEDAGNGINVVANNA